MKRILAALSDADRPVERIIGIVGIVSKQHCGRIIDQLLAIDHMTADPLP